ncbi:MAG: NYN domain-containing protein [Treponema sp.]|nr:NYN domain-containing protein [Treponema sp.]
MIKSNFFIDGNFVYHINKFLIDKYNKQIDWKRLIEYLRTVISDENRSSTQESTVQISSKYFVGTSAASGDTEREYFFNSLDHAGVIKNALPLSTGHGVGGKEKGVDVALALEAILDYFQARDENKFSYFILFAGDTDFVPLIRSLKQLGIKTVLVYMDFEHEGHVTRTGQALLETVDTRINFSSIVSERVDGAILAILKQRYDNSMQESFVRYNKYSAIPWNVVRECMNECIPLPSGYVKLPQLGEKIKKKCYFIGNLKKILQDQHGDKLEFGTGAAGINGGDTVRLAKQEIFVINRKKS